MREANFLEVGSGHFKDMEEKMNSRYIPGRRKNILANILMIPLFLIASYAAVKVGITAGDMLFDMDIRFIENIEAESFKIALNKSFPIIDTIYNSGNVNASLAGEVNSLIRYIFNFDINSPLTILNAQSPFFYNYYYNSYVPIIAKKEGENKDEDKLNKALPQNEQKEKTGNDEETQQYLEAVSSITFDETDEKDFSKSDIVSSGKIVIQNETKIKIDEAEIKKLLKEPLKFNFNKKKDRILIYHTHTTESFIKSLDELDKKVSNRTSDAKHNVVRVGDELTKILEKEYELKVLHNGTIHDYPYNSSYSNSLRTLDKYLKSYPSIKIAFDIHRDGLGNNQPRLRLEKKIDGKNAAQIMFVVGTNEAGLNHPKWKENLKLAIKLQEKLNKQCPGLARPIFISKNRYNQHMIDGSLIIEIGGDGNLISECLESTKYLAKAIDDVISP
jgi:stage II sporulation protein P